MSRSSGWTQVERVTATPQYGEISLSLASDGSGVLWTDRRLDGEARMGLYEVAFDGSKLSVSGSLNDLHENDPSNENYAAIAADGSFVIFANYDVGGDGTDEDLYIVRRSENGWSAPVDLGPLVNSARSETSPSFSPDGETFFFVSGVEGGSQYYAVAVSDIPALAE